MTPSGLIFDLQRFSVHDGPGIRTTVFLKGCPLRCAWCQNPESLRPEKELLSCAERCSGFGACFRVCPKGALKKTGERVSRKECDGCGLCVPECPYQVYEVVGREVDALTLVEELLEDLPFFESSGGGITLSGGEPTFQMQFMGAVASRCKSRGLSVGLQTCGAFFFDAFEPHLALFDFIHFDLKVMDDKEHRRLTGASNKSILANARRLIEREKPVIFRMPIVPGLTDTEENLQAVGLFLRELGRRQVSLLPYHPLGEAKLARVGFPIPPLSLADGRADLDRPQRLFGNQGIEAVL